MILRIRRFELIDKVHYVKNRPGRIYQGGIKKTTEILNILLKGALPNQ
jgi:hypothetical protein